MVRSRIRYLYLAVLIIFVTITAQFSVYPDYIPDVSVYPEQVVDAPVYASAARSDCAGQTVFLGGQSVGFSVKSDGVIVLGVVEIETSVGRMRPQTDVEAGDIITELDGKRILYIDDIVEVMRSYDKTKSAAELRVLRAGKEKKVTSYPVIEQYTGFYKLGFEVKEYAEGIGTVTYIKPNGEFGALGHPINSNDGSLLIPCYGGNVYKCKIVGCNRGKKGTPGDLRGMFLTPQGALGKVRTNGRFGVYGNLDASPATEQVEIASRHHVRPGKAQIVATIKDVPERFDIEIIKAMPQAGQNEKGMVIRVTDKRLLSVTGGIVQGMSGSPIIQNGKLVGAVTHVFVSDPTKGYAVYMDWMFQ